MKPFKWLLISAAALAALMVTSCSGGYSEAGKKQKASEMKEYLEEKYSEAFIIEKVEELRYHRVGALTSGEVAGVQAAAYPAGNPETEFRVEYWEKENVIEDGYINLIMSDKLAELVQQKVQSIWKTPAKLDVVYFEGPFGSLPDSSYTPAAEVKDYPYAAGINVFMAQEGELDKRVQATQIRQLNQELKEYGIADFLSAVFFMNQEDYSQIEATLQDIDEKKDDEYNLYSFCRPKADCWVSGGQGDETVEELIADFSLGKE
ncbi:hypothetical protein [Paenibacillus typhae]|uniref:Uncharacterized protein n=2 Tax=Paenibacillus typhae TaxID=1174501 RepID=A0A1G8JLJ6_9BACL|nr:hypothetical protein [Paenibacillus typhae]SDI32022.1 hypothetical protein SAMN05216192_104223 [Paenibacillus typhae]